MGGMIAGIMVSSLISAISGYMGAQAQAEAYKTLAAATKAERQQFQQAYDQAYGEGSYNQQMQALGAQASNQYYSMLNDTSAWDRYINGSEAYQAPEAFSFSASDLYADPSYKVRLNEGLGAVEQSLLASGYSDSGRAAKALNNYAQEQASKEYSNAYNRAYQQYTDDRNFDYNAWKNEANQYYSNLTNRLSGLSNVSNMGATASQAQANALTALAGNNASAIQQQASAQAAASQAETGQYTSVLDALAKGINYGVGVAASQAGSTPTNTTTPSNVSYQDVYDTEMARMINEYNNSLTAPSTTNIVGA